MKYFIFNVIILINILYANDSMQMIDIKIKDIDKQREGITKELLAKIKNPFYMPAIVVEKNITVVNPPKKEELVPPTIIPEKKALAPLKLSLIINNSALINNKWYHVGDDVEGYIVLGIHLDYIIVDQYGDKVRLNMQAKNDNIQFKKVKKALKQENNK